MFAQLLFSLNGKFGVIVPKILGGPRHKIENVDLLGILSGCQNNFQNSYSSKIVACKPRYVTISFGYAITQLIIEP